MLDLMGDFVVDAEARRLIAAGVPTELHVYPGALHGFNLMRDDALARMLAKTASAA